MLGWREIGPELFKKHSVAFGDLLRVRRVHGEAGEGGRRKSEGKDKKGSRVVELTAAGLEL
jgi:hypothetical protein